MPEEIYKLQALNARKLPLKEINGVQVRSEKIKDIGNDIVFVTLVDDRKIDSRKFSGLVDSLADLIKKTGKTFMICPSNVKMFKLVKIEDNNENNH